MELMSKVNHKWTEKNDRIMFAYLRVLLLLEQYPDNYFMEFDTDSEQWFSFSFSIPTSGTICISYFPVNCGATTFDTKSMWKYSTSEGTSKLHLIENNKFLVSFTKIRNNCVRFVSACSERASKEYEARRCRFTEINADNMCVVNSESLNSVLKLCLHFAIGSTEHGGGAASAGACL